ncbi:hypothetical protein AB0N07_14555 [Streptomyces sp. NPDC051172]|uniref:hypothetical protein n=1 Tax=Streptomyces sp. NPDC051172 TaxID=3155796 RepID=UPI003445498B
MTPPPDIAHHGPLAAAGTRLAAADRQAASAAAQLRTHRKTIDTNLGASLEQPPARAASTCIRRTA